MKESEQSDKAGQYDAILYFDSVTSQHKAPLGFLFVSENVDENNEIWVNLEVKQMPSPMDDKQIEERKYIGNLQQIKFFGQYD